MTTVNTQISISEQEHKRLCLEYLRKRYNLGYDFEGDSIVRWESGYQDQESKVVVAKVTPAHLLAKQLYELLKKEK